jgi:hypothetical protein
MVFLPNPPEADKSLRLPREMFILLNAQPIQPGQSLFLWGYAQKTILGISNLCRLVPVLQRGGYFFRMP